jgi:hypothetical protein
MRTFGFLQTALSVESSDEAALEWLEEFLCPWFESPASGRGLDTRVRHVVDADGAPSDRREPPASIGFVSLDSGVVRLPAWRDGGRVVLDDARGECRYTFEALDTPGFGVIVQARSRARRLGLMRVIREIAVEHERRRAHPLQLHAAAFEIGGGAVVLAGPKLSGKTTLLLHAVTRLPARLVANDRVLVHRAAGAPWVTGVPGVISVRPATASAFPGLSSLTPRVDHPAQLTLAEADHALAMFGPADGGARLRFSRAQLSRSLPLAFGVAATLRAVVFPESDRATGSPAVSRLSPAEALDRLRTSVYGGHGADARTIVAEMVGRARPMGADPAAVRDAETEALARLASEVPCFRLIPGDGIAPAIELLHRTVLA